MTEHDPHDPHGPPPPPPPPPPGDLPPPPPVARPPSSALDLTAAFQFGWDAFRATPGPLVAAVVLTYVALVVALGVAFGGVALVAVAGGESVVGIGLTLVLGLVGFVGFALVAQLPTVVLLRAGQDAVEGRAIELGRILRTAGLGRLCGAMALVMLGVLVGYVFLVLPGIVFGVLAGFTLHHLVEDESLSPVDGIRASIATVRARPWPSIGVLLVTGLVAGLGAYACGVGVVVSLPVAVIAQVHGFRQVTGRALP